MTHYIKIFPSKVFSEKDLYDLAAEWNDRLRKSNNIRSIPDTWLFKTIGDKLGKETSEKEKVNIFRTVRAVATYLTSVEGRSVLEKVDVDDGDGGRTAKKEKTNNTSLSIIGTEVTFRGTIISVFTKSDGKTKKCVVEDSYGNLFIGDA